MTTLRTMTYIAALAACLWFLVSEAWQLKLNRDAAIAQRDAEFNRILDKYSGKVEKPL